MHAPAKPPMIAPSRIRPDPMTSTCAQPSRELDAALTLLFACGTGLAVATLYYNQPMLAVIGADLGASPRALGLIPTLTQLGYAAGIALLAPLGDRHDRRRVIVLKAVALVVALVAAAHAPTLPLLGAASLAVGVFATLAQDIVPAAAALAPASARGRVVGQVMMGLLLGILLSRVISGAVAARYGWRVMFDGAALSIALLAAVAARRLPAMAPTTTLRYRALLASLAVLWRRHPPLRAAAWAQGLLMLAFGAFWSTLAIALHAAPFHLGSAAAGAYGLAGAAGALAAPLAGRIADRRGPGAVTRLGTALVTVSFAALLLLSHLRPGAALWLIGAASVGFDLGIQATLVAHQTIIYALDADARSRVNAVLIFAMFVGMASGSALGSALFGVAGWNAVAALATMAAGCALAVRWRARGSSNAA